MQALLRNKGAYVTPKIGTTKVFWAIWTDRSDLSYKPVRPKLARLRFSGQSGQTSQTSHMNRSDRSRQVCQIANWTAPLRRSRRDDRNTYIERPIRSSDEGVMPLGRPAARSDRSDRSRAVKPVRNAQSELGVVF